MHNRMTYGNGLGRPKIENPLHRVSCRIEKDCIDWIKENGGSVVIRQLIDEAMKKESDKSL